MYNEVVFLCIGTDWYEILSKYYVLQFIFVIYVAFYGRHMEYGRPLYFCPVVSVFFLFYSSPNLSGRRLDVYHTSTHGVALVRI